MIVRIRNEKENRDRHIDCVSAVIFEVKHKEKDQQPALKGETFHELVAGFGNGKDITLPLVKGDMIFYMNNEGKTIDRNFRFANM